MKRPQFDVGFAYAAHVLARRAEEVHVRLAANGVECASRFEIAGRSGRLAAWTERGPIDERMARVSMAPTEPALPIWRGTLAGPASSSDATNEPRTSGLVVIPGPLTRGRR